MSVVLSAKKHRLTHANRSRDPPEVVDEDQVRTRNGPVRNWRLDRYATMHFAHRHAGYGIVNRDTRASLCEKTITPKREMDL